MKRLLYQTILLADDNPSFFEKLNYVFQIIIKTAPFAYLISSFGVWFTKNEHFAVGLIVSFAINMVVGIIYHRKMKTFSWEEFFYRNIVMWVICLSVYWILDIWAKTLGDNIIGDTFLSTVQFLTLFYPGSKILKNCYIISNKKIPPKFLMERIYNFERTGNIDDLLNDK